MALAVATGAGFVVRERRAADPMVPLAMLAIPTVSVAAAGRPVADAVQTTFIVAAAVAALAAIVMVALPAAVDRDASAS